MRLLCSRCEALRRRWTQCCFGRLSSNTWDMKLLEETLLTATMHIIRTGLLEPFFTQDLQRIVQERLQLRRVLFLPEQLEALDTIARAMGAKLKRIRDEKAKKTAVAGRRSSCHIGTKLRRKSFDSTTTSGVLETSNAHVSSASRVQLGISKPMTRACPCDILSSARACPAPARVGRPSAASETTEVEFLL